MASSTATPAIQQDFLEIIQIPDGRKIVKGTPLNVTLLFSNISMIKSVHLLYCSIDPVFSCHFPIIDLNLSTQDSFSTVFLPEYEVGTIFGYHFDVNFYNGSTLGVPNSINFPNNKTNIRQAEDGHYYFELLLIGESSTKSYDTSWFKLYSICILSIFVLIIRRIRKFSL